MKKHLQTNCTLPLLFTLALVLAGMAAMAQCACSIGINAISDSIVCTDSVHLRVTTLDACNIYCITNGNPINQSQDDQIAFLICESEVEYGACDQEPFLMIAVIDSFCLKAWDNCNKNFGQVNIYTSANCDNNYTLATCRPRPENYFEFRFADSASINNAVNMLKNNIPQNDFILVYTFESVDLSKYPKLVNELQSLGSSIISTLGNVPYIFLVKNGHPSTAQEVAGSNSTSVITLTANVISTSFSNIVYSWSPGSTLNDSTIQSPLAFPKDTTKYYVTVTDTVNHCNSVDSVTVNYNCPSGIEEHSLSNEINISPNPSSGYFIIKSASVKLKKLIVINTIGQFISETDTHNSSTLTVNTSQLAEGIYFVQITDEKGRVVNKKIVVQ